MLIRVGERKVGQRFRIRLISKAAYLEWISNVLRSISETCGPSLPESRNGSVGMSIKALGTPSGFAVGLVSTIADATLDKYFARALS